MVDFPLDPPESKEKCYTFTCMCNCKINFSVWGENLEQAEDRLRSNEVEDMEILKTEIDYISSYDIEK